jgi:hypothetical protein
MTGTPCGCWHAEDVLQESKLDHPSPHPPTRIPKHLHDSTPGIPVNSCVPLPMYLSQAPPGGRRFVANKGLSVIRPNGDRTVEALFQLVIEPVLAISHTSLLVPGFQVSFTAYTLRRCGILADSGERIKSELRKSPFFPPFPRARKKARGFSGKG